MDCFEGFDWAVPTSFSDALDRCRFERGDRIYPTRRAYELRWTDALDEMESWMQVRSPERGATGTTVSDGAKSVFEGSWASEVELTLHRRGGGSVDLTTTQGRLYSALWGGDLGMIEGRGADPQAPHRSTATVVERLEGLDRSLSEAFEGLPTFIMPFDRVNRGACDKFARLDRALSPHLPGKPKLLVPADAGLPDPHTLAPTVCLACFSAADLSAAELNEAVKSVVYVPDPDAKTSRFRLAAHGVLV